MPRPMEHGDVIAFRASRAVRQTLETAAAWRRGLSLAC